MPKLYEYLGITFFFYSNEHDPIHVHCKYQGTETKIIIYLKNGKVHKIAHKHKGKGLCPDKTKQAIKLVEYYADDIVEMWIDFFIRDINKIKFKQINKI